MKRLSRGGLLLVVLIAVPLLVGLGFRALAAPSDPDPVQQPGVTLTPGSSTSTVGPSGDPDPTPSSTTSPSQEPTSSSTTRPSKRPTSTPDPQWSSRTVSPPPDYDDDDDDDGDDDDDDDDDDDG